MSDCIPNADKTACIHCGWKWIHPEICEWPKRICTNPPEGSSRILHGPGDFLHDAILRWVGEGPTRECGCTDRIAKMNTWGPSGCREHLDEIAGWLAEEAAKRGWWRYAVAVPGSRFFIKRMVLGAIKQAEKAATDTNVHLTGGAVENGPSVAQDAMLRKDDSVDQQGHRNARAGHTRIRFCENEEIAARTSDHNDQKFRVVTVTTNKAPY